MKTKVAGLIVLSALALTVPLVLPSAAAAEQKVVHVFNNRDSGLLRYRNCRYRLQAGYYGNVAYLQLKARSTSCRPRGVDRPNSAPRGRPSGSYAEVDTIHRGQPAVTIKRSAGKGVRLTQATGPVNGRFMQGAYSAADAAYRICSTSSSGSKCDTGFVDVFPFHY